MRITKMPICRWPGAAIDRFARLNPTHPNIDYVIYMRGLTNMALDDSALQGLLRRRSFRPRPAARSRRIQ